MSVLFNVCNFQSPQRGEIKVCRWPSVLLGGFGDNSSFVVLVAVCLLARAEAPHIQSFSFNDMTVKAVTNMYVVYKTEGWISLVSNLSLVLYITASRVRVGLFTAPS